MEAPRISVLSTSKNAPARISGTTRGWLTAATAAAASPATAAVLSLGGDPQESPERLSLGGDPQESPERPWRLPSPVTVVEPNRYAWVTQRTWPGGPLQSWSAEFA